MWVKKYKKKLKEKIEKLEKENTLIENKELSELKEKLEQLDIGYKVFSLMNKPGLRQDGNNQIPIFNKRDTKENTLYNMMAATGKRLDCPIKEVIEKNLYEVNGDMYLLNEITKNDLKKV